jgi:hypothetical protein
MNLHIKFDGVEQFVYQTPTYISLMCVMTSKGINSSVTGKKASRAVLCYIAWVESLKNGVYNSLEERDSHCEPINDHLKNIKHGKWIAKNIEVYIQ